MIAMTSTQTAVESAAYALHRDAVTMRPMPGEPFPEWTDVHAQTAVGSRVFVARILGATLPTAEAWHAVAAALLAEGFVTVTETLVWGDDDSIATTWDLATGAYL